MVSPPCGWGVHFLATDASGEARPHNLYWHCLRERGAIALFEDFTLGSVTSTALVGLGLVAAAPLLVPVVGAVIRPVMRLAIKSSIAAYDTVAALVITAGEDLHQIVTEACAELTPALDPMPPSEDITPHIIRPEEASA